MVPRENVPPTSSPLKVYSRRKVPYHHPKHAELPNSSPEPCNPAPEPISNPVQPMNEADSAIPGLVSSDY